MSVYEMTWAGSNNFCVKSAMGADEAVYFKNTSVNLFLDVLTNTPHTYIFIITKEQWPDFREQAKSWMPFVIHDTKDYIWNPNYVGESYRPRLRLIVFQGKGTDES